MTCSACQAPIGGEARFCAMCGTPVKAPSAPRESRKNVAILFMDVVGSTALAEKLDAGSWRQIIDRYYDAAQSTIAAHGGQVEKLVGDAVMAVFGAAVSHEDDALRAVRAAMDAITQAGELSAGLAASHEYKLEIRCGIGCGEVIAITERSGDVRVVGDPVNIAARLQTAAEPSEILLDAVSATMVRASIGLDPLPPLELKGKAQPVTIWRVTSSELPGDPTDTAPPAPLVGRQDKLDELRSAFERVTDSNQPFMVTLFGAPGIGKSRLVRDFVGAFEPDEVTVLTAKCSADARGMTYQPLADMLDALDDGWTEHARRIESSGDQGRRAAACLASVGPHNQSAADVAGVQDISWAVRYLLSHLGQTGPVVMVWEDLHWATPTLLDMIEGVVDWIIDVPVLLICVARTELAEARPAWGEGKPNAMALDLTPLSYEQSAELVATIAKRSTALSYQRDVEQDVLFERVARICEGNPLFAELMLDVSGDSPPEPGLPPTISGLMSARFDQLPSDERKALEIASAIGRDFSWAALRAVLAADDVGDTQAQDIVGRLLGRRLISRVSSDCFMFAQPIMRDVAYGQSPKATRERLHLLLADLLAQRADDDSSADNAQVLVYHVEMASTLARELRPDDAELPALASKAAEILVGEGIKALRRRDLHGAATLLERCRGLIRASDELQVPLMLYVSDCWYEMSDPDRALAAVDAVAGTADRRRDLVCAIQRSIIELRFGLKTRDEIAEASHQHAAELRWQDGNDRAACRLHQLEAYLHLPVQRHALAESEFRTALDHARSLRDSYEEGRILVAICEVSQWSPMTVQEGLRVCAEMSERFATSGQLYVLVLLTRARLAALGGDLKGARAALASARAFSSDLHLGLVDAAIMGVTALVDALAGDHRIAEMSYRQAQGMLIEMGRPQDAATYEAYAAREVFEQGKVREAGAALARLLEGAPAIDLRTQVVADALSARIAAASGQAAQVLDLAIAAAKLSEQTDDLCLQGDCYCDLAIAAAQAGNQALAAEAASKALDRYRVRGASRLTIRAHRLVAAVGEPGVQHSGVPR